MKASTMNPKVIGPVWLVAAGLCALLGGVVFAWAPPPPPPPAVLTVEVTPGVEAAKVRKESSEPFITWLREPDGGPDDFPATLVVDHQNERNPVVIKAYDYKDWYFHRWEWYEDEELVWKEEDEEKDPRTQLTLEVWEDITRTAVFLYVDMDIYDGQGGPKISEADENTRGALSHANMNDTDQDGVVDYQDDYVPGEVDLIKVVLNYPEPPAKVGELAAEGNLTTVFLGITAGAGCKLWKHATKSASEEDMEGEETRRTFPLTDLRMTLWLEGGLNEDPEEPAVPVTLTCCYADNFYAKDVAKATFFDIASIEWRKYSDNADLGDYCPNNYEQNDPIKDSQQVFPDKKTYSDEYPLRRTLVWVRATVNPPEDMVSVFFRSYDVDDPSGDAYPIDWTTDWPVPKGEDNRGTPKEGEFVDVNGQPLQQPVEVLTDDTGTAWIRFRVTMKPGDNFRVLASDRYDFVSGHQDWADNPTLIPHKEGKRTIGCTRMLTVWRKLHLELDSMAAGQDNRITSREITDTIDNYPHAGESGAEIEDFEPNDDGRYEGGRVSVEDGGTYEILENRDEVGDDWVYVKGSITDDLGKLASFGDDDVCPLPRKVNWSLMNEKFKPAYVKVEEEQGVSNIDATFVANVSSIVAVFDTVVGPARQRLTSVAYWVTEIVSCHQGRDSADADPDMYYHYHSSTDYKSGDQEVVMGSSLSEEYDGRNVSVVYLESIRDMTGHAAWARSQGLDAPVCGTAEEEEMVTVVHEVGHICGGEHQHGGIMRSDPPARATDVFQPITLDLIRWGGDIEHETRGPWL